MNKFLFYIGFIILMLTTFTGCLRTYYPALFRTSANTIIYETVDSRQENHKFISADITNAKGDYADESMQMIKCNYTIVRTKDYSNINYKFFGYGGNYKVSGLQEYDGNKSFFGVGGEFTASINFKISSLKIGLGFNTAIVTEMGEYYNFRREAKSKGKIESDQGLIFFTVSAFPVLSYELSQSTILTTQVNLGTPGLMSPCIMLNSKGYVIWISWLPDNENRESIIGNRFTIGFQINLNNF